MKSNVVQLSQFLFEFDLRSYWSDKLPIRLIDSQQRRSKPTLHYVSINANMSIIW